MKMTLFIQILVFFAAVVAVTLGQPKDYNDCTGPVIYVKVAQTNILDKVELGLKDADAIDARYADRLAVIELQQQQILNEIQHVNQTFAYLQYLSFSRKFCIKTYDSQWEYFDKAQQQFKDCNNAAKINAIELTHLGRNYLSIAYSYAINELDLNVEECSEYWNNQTRLEACYIDYVTDGNLRAQLQLDGAEKAFRQSVWDMEDYTLTAVKCSHQIQLSVLYELKSFKTQVSDCVRGFYRKDISQSSAQET